MNLPITQYPTEGSSNENVLFATLGAFWTKIFKDQAAIKGLTLAHAEEIYQDYYRLIEAIDSYSAKQIAVFQKIKWLPLMIKKSELNSNVLRFGEGVKFGQYDGEYYTFGKPHTQEDQVFVVPLPEDLREISVITNRVISPDFVLANNIDVRINGAYLYFYGNPFELPNVSKFNLLDDEGNQVYYLNPLTQQPIPDEVVTLWVYNGYINTNSLNYNIAYLFGVSLPNTELSREVLEATVKLFSGGPTIHQLKALSCAFLGVKPIIEDNEVVTDIFQTSTDCVLVTNKHVYRYDLYYTLKPEVMVGTTLQMGDIPVDAVEFYDNVTFSNWWLTKMAPKISIEAQTTVQSPAMFVPPYMFVGSYQYCLKFNNAMELITRSENGWITFPVEGDPSDVQKFQQQVNLYQEELASAVGGLTNGSALLINPFDFLFRSVFRNNSAMLKINFKDRTQLQQFTEYFEVVKKCLPKHVYFVFFFDVRLPNELYKPSYIDDTTASGLPVARVQTNYVGPSIVHQVSMNRIVSNTDDCNGLVKELVFMREPTTGVTTRDYGFIELMKDPEA